MKPVISESELEKRLASLPRIRLATLPTPLEETPRLVSTLGGPNILVKREDMTGLAFGGNKIREFEYSLAAAVEQEYDVLLNSAAAQSNQSRLTAAAAAKLGLRSVIIGSKDAHARPVQGNLLLCHLLGAEVHIVDPDQQVEEKRRLIANLEAKGHKVFDTGYDGAVFRSVAYVDGFLELWGQCKERRIQPEAVYLCSGGHTHVGLVVAAKALGIDLRIAGIPYSTRRDAAVHASLVAEAANQAAHALNLHLGFSPQDIEIYTEFTAPGYGVMSEGTKEAIYLAARNEGLLLDPVYTGKAMAGLIAHIREGRYTRDQTVIFLHTGGAPGLFAYNTELGFDP